MGRPKKSDLKCAVCNKAFMLKHSFLVHMKSHRGRRRKRQIRTSSKWCQTCRKIFNDSEYKLHIQSEPQCGLHNQGRDCSVDDVILKSGYVLLNRSEFKKELDKQYKGSSKEKGFSKRSILPNNVSDIKIEPIEIPSNKVPTKIGSKISLIFKCRECGMRCKGQSGFRNHVRMSHRLQRKCSSDILQSNIKNQLEGNGQQPETIKIQSTQEFGGHPIFIPNNGLINLNLNSQSQIFPVAFPLNSVVTIGNQPNVQLLSTPSTQNVNIVEIIPKFNYDSESYMKWLKKFIEKCKIQKYPLPQLMCENISHVLEEILYAIGNPVGSLKKKSDHFFVMRMYEILSKVLIGHMRHSLL